MAGGTKEAEALQALGEIRSELYSLIRSISVAKHRKDFDRANEMIDRVAELEAKREPLRQQVKTRLNGR